MTDFGLAKATTQLETTDPGVVKGKFSYLSPEAAMGQEVDARADVFALGIVLWEMLAGRRLFLGETDYQTVKLVQQANIPSLRRLNPEVDAANSRRSCSRALTRDPNDRYQSARDFGDALAGYIFSHQMKVTAYDIANLIRGVVVQKERRSQEQSIIDRLIQEELLSFTSLDDMADPLNPGAHPLSPEQVEGAHPLDAGSFENPADWFADDQEVGEALEEHGKTVGLGSSPGWRESAALPAEEPSDLAQLLEGGDTGKHVAAPPRIKPPATAPAPRSRVSTNPGYSQNERAVPAPPRAPPPARPEPYHPPPPVANDDDDYRPPRGGGGGAWMYVVIVLVLLAGAGAAAWFGGLIPH